MPEISLTPHVAQGVQASQDMYLASRSQPPNYIQEHAVAGWGQRMGIRHQREEEERVAVVGGGKIRKRKGREGGGGRGRLGDGDRGGGNWLRPVTAVPVRELYGRRRRAVGPQTARKRPPACFRAAARGTPSARRRHGERPPCQAPRPAAGGATAVVMAAAVDGGGSTGDGGGGRRRWWRLPRRLRRRADAAEPRGAGERAGRLGWAAGPHRRRCDGVGPPRLSRAARPPA